MKSHLWVLFALTPALHAGTLSWDALPAKVQAAPAAQALALDAAAYEKRQSNVARSFSPRLSAFASARHESFYPGSNESWPEAGLHASANLWRGGQDQAKKSYLHFLAQAARSRATNNHNLLLLRVRQTWLTAWSARSRMESLKQAQARCEEDLKRIRQQSAAGLVPKSDILALQILSSELDQHLFDESHLADEAEHHLAALLGLPPSEAENLIDASNFEWPQAQSTQGSKRPAQAALEAEAKSLAEQRGSLNGFFQPSFDLEAQARAGRAGLALSDARDYKALATLSLSFDAAGAGDRERDWLGGLGEAKKKEYEAQLKADEVEREELGHALQSWVGRRGVVEARLAQGMEFRKAVLEENKRGVRDSRDLLESNEAVLEAEADLTVAKGRAWGVWAELEGFGEAK